MDLFHPLNIEKSVRKRRLIYKLTFKLVLDYMGYFFIGTLLYGVCFILAHALFEHTNVPSLIIKLFNGLLTIWIIADVLFCSLTVKLTGRGKGRNKKALNDILNAKYKRLTRLSATNDMMRYKQEPKIAGSIYLITCLFDNDEAFINITSLGKGSGFLPFNGLFNYLQSRRIAKTFSNYKFD